MLNFRRLAIPTVIALAIGGIISFLLAFNFYPEKHVNVNIEGDCYELLGKAFEEYRNLVNENELNKLRMYVNFIEGNNTLIPITITGTENELDSFRNTYNFTVDSKTIIANNSQYKKVIAKGVIPKMNLLNLTFAIKPADMDPMRQTVYSSIGIRSNIYLTNEESKIISNDSFLFMKNGIKRIISQGEDVKPAECRSKIIYN